jgi:chromate transporter
MVNLATYVGSHQAGLAGAVIATLAVVLPSFLIILLVMILFKTLLKNKYVQAILRGLKPCVIGIVLATGAYMVVHNMLPLSGGMTIDIRAGIITAILVTAMLLYPKITKKKMSSIALICISAILGIVIYSI